MRALEPHIFTDPAHALVIARELARTDRYVVRYQGGLTVVTDAPKDVIGLLAVWVQTPVQGVLS